MLTPPNRFSSPGSSQLPDKWWQSFQDTTLDRLVAVALEGNFTLGIAWDRLRQAEAAARRERASTFPTLNATGSAAASERKSTGGANAGRSSSTELSLGLASSYELDLWGRLRADREAAFFDAQATREDVNTAAITLSAQVATAWYRLVQQHRQIDLLNRQLSYNEENLELVTLRFRQGQTKAEDVLQQRQQAESRRGEIARARANEAVLRHQLAILLGQSPNNANVADPSAELLRLPPLPATGIPMELIQRRPDTRRAFYGVLAADSRVAAALAERFPRLSISAQASASGQRLQSVFDNWLASLATNLAAPIVDGGTRRAEVDRTRAVASESLNSYAQVVLNALGEVEDALAREQRQAEYIASLERQLQWAGGVIERTKDNYMKGIDDYIRVLSAQQTYQSLERTHLDARGTEIEIRIALCRALSGGWDMTRPTAGQPAGRQVSGIDTGDHTDDN